MCIVCVHAYPLSVHLTYSIYFHHRPTLQTQQLITNVYYIKNLSHEKEGAH